MILKKPLLLIAATIFSISTLSAQNLKAYQIFDKNGQPVTFSNIVDVAVESDIVLFGELHNNPISHWLQLELTMALHKHTSENLVMGMEMFEADDQLIIDEYFSGLISERNFLSEARLWNNYNTDIRPLLEFARENELLFIATNIPRRYAALVNREGFEGLEKLSSEALRFVAPLPVAYDPELPGYKAMLEMTGMPAHANENFPRAQAIKDATMAHFIMKNFSPGNTFIHFHGAFHSNNYEGIVWYLQRLQSDLKLMTISTVEQDQVGELNEEYLNQADFIIAVPATMTKTY
ncbi:MAG: ChaN family lipoprotein [Bacteroidales bacterium]|nr:ChaN family lipoprotein [Bacteroidales bacterium]